MRELSDVANCNSYVDDAWVRNVLGALEEESQIIKRNHDYLVTRIMMKRWKKPPETSQPTSQEDLNSFLLP